ncbi:MAG TPA: GntR family transcriptional regulator [Propionibacteriaceae bacterium]
MTINQASPVPPFEQVRTQIIDKVRRGELAAGDQLPTVRALANVLGLAPNTVARAYKELDQDGIVSTAGRRGTVVADQRVQVSDGARKKAETFVAAVQAMGLTPNETMRLVRHVLHG